MTRPHAHDRGMGPAAGEPAAAGAPLDTSDGLAALNELFLDAYAARRGEILARMGPAIAQIGDRLILRRGGQRFEGPARTRRFHALKGISHVPLAIHMLLAGRSGALDDATRRRITALQRLTAAVAGDLDRRGFTADELERQRRLLAASLAFLDEVIAAGRAAPGALAAFTSAQAPDILRNVEDAARDQIETMHATVERWKQQMTPEERDRLQVVVAVSHMARPGNVAVQYFSVTLGERWEGRFDVEDLLPDKRVVAAEAALDEEAAFELLATRALDNGISARFFSEETRLERDLLADAAERILARMFHREPEPPGRPAAVRGSGPKKARDVRRDRNRQRGPA